MAGLKAVFGYQIIPELFAGAGVGFNYWYDADDSNIGIPVFADFRYDMRLDGKWGFFADVKLGYSLVDIEGFYFSPTIGARYAMSERCGLNLGLGYESQKAKEYDNCTDISGAFAGWVFRVGIDF